MYTGHAAREEMNRMTTHSSDNHNRQRSHNRNKSWYVAAAAATAAVRILAYSAILAPSSLFSEALILPDNNGNSNSRRRSSNSGGSRSTSSEVSKSINNNNNSQNNSRRDFLAQSAAAAAVASTSPLSLLWTPTPVNAVDGAVTSATPTISMEGVSSSSSTTTILPNANMMNDRISSNAGKKFLKLPPMGLGCWSWGDSLFWGYNPKNDADLKQVFDYAVTNHSPVLFDTAELYGFGRSESLIGEYSQSVVSDGLEDPPKIVVATKFAALPFRTRSDSVVKACEASVKRLGGGGGGGGKPIDLYQIHFPGAWANEAYWDGMAECYEKGLIKAVGVSNYGVDATRACAKALEKRGIPLASNQIQYSLLYRFPEDNGLLQACDDLGVQVLAYSPLALGLLAGKYVDTDSLQNIQGPRKQLFAKTVQTPEFQNLLAVMKEVTAGHTSYHANIPQVAINWCRSKGTIPIPGARTLRQIQSNYGALEWDLTPEEIQKLDAASANLSYILPEANPMPRFDKDLQLQMFDS